MSKLGDTCIETGFAGFTHIFVMLRNLEHVRTVYGDDFVHALVKEISFRGHSRGAIISMVGEGAFLMHMHVGFPTSYNLALQELERWQLVLSAPPFEIEGTPIFPVLSVGFVTLDLFGAPSLAEINQITPPAPMPLPEVHCSTDWRLSYESDMEFAACFYRGLGRQDFALAFQPIVSLGEGGETLYEEGLLRSVENLAHRTTAGEDTISTLEKLGLIRRLDRSVVLSLLGMLRQEPQVKLGCNISSSSAVDDAWWISILELLALRPDLASRLTVEITEYLPMLHPETAVDFVRRLQTLGCRIAIDDFGSGFTTLDFVRRVQPDIIKIHAGYLHRARESEQSVEVLSNLVGISSRFAPNVVIEGVESEEDLVLARGTSANWAQGNLFKAPQLWPSWSRHPLFIRSSSL
ncbi:EAL domain-containing protein [Ectopseudomonas khazarica]|uniref:Putative Diguanylate cyclase/phosphodiesterase (GGDEF & EAL domain) with PAS/PAC sensor(S) n=1 Tax=Ectopseudomonas oleovorans TaxID=301 RepID=A0A653BA49_ECTOL|nr:Putative Diguanylate cyclase/phosphodiesterase (GGDEF & EAL domain) with PAS/PAC sensor(S) [Pseudomonas oleovorans]